MQLQINGNPVKVPDDLVTVSELIEHLGLNSSIVIVEQNHTIVEKNEHTVQKIKDGDIIELVQFVGGG